MRPRYIAYIVNFVVGMFLSAMVFDVTLRVSETLDSAPVYIVSEEPVVLTPYLHAGDTVTVRWWGRYRRKCPGLMYTRWLGRYEDGEEHLLKFPNVPSSSSEATEYGTSIFSWRLPKDLEPGVYFWRSEEIAVCRFGVIHRNHLDDAWFEVLDPREAIPSYADEAE